MECAGLMAKINKTLNRRGGQSSKYEQFG